jgi:hypothetical protein
VRPLLGRPSLTASRPAARRGTRHRWSAPFRTSAAAPSGSQFYIVAGEGPAPNYDVFGQCATESAIAIAQVARDASDKPTTPVHIQKIEIARCPAK